MPLWYVIPINIYKPYYREESDTSSSSLGCGELNECKLLTTCLCTILVPNYIRNWFFYMQFEMFVNWIWRIHLGPILGFPHLLLWKLRNAPWVCIMLQNQEYVRFKIFCPQYHLTHLWIDENKINVLQYWPKKQM